MVDERARRATNIVTPLADAYMDSIPIVAITGQVPTPVDRHRRVPGGDITGITMPVTKHNFLVKDRGGPRRRPSARRSTSPRPAGPARCCRPPEGRRCKPTMDLELARREVDAARLQARPPRATRGRSGGGEADPARPSGRSSTSGGGIIKADAAEELRELAELDRHPRRHDADGARRVPRRPPAVPRHAGHARQLHGRHRDAEGRPADRARRPLRRPRHRQARRASRRDAKIIHVDIDPAEHRQGPHGPTCRSSATAAT